MHPSCRTRRRQCLRRVRAQLGHYDAGYAGEGGLEAAPTGEWADAAGGWTGAATA